MRAARAIDNRLNRNDGGGFTADNQGPFERHLRTYGDGKIKCILGPVAGFFEGISDDFSEILDMCVDQGSHVLFHAMGCNTLDQCRSTLLWQLRRDIGTASLTESECRPHPQSQEVSWWQLGETTLPDPVRTRSYVSKRGLCVYGRLQAERGLRDGRACGHDVGSLGAVGCLRLMWSVKGFGCMGAQVPSPWRSTCGGSSFSLPFTVYVGKLKKQGLVPEAP